MIYTVTFLFKVEQLMDIPLPTVVTNILGSSVFGLVLAGMVIWLDRTVKGVGE